MKDNNNNLTLLILLIGVIILVLYCRKSYREENYTNFVNKNTLDSINTEIEGEITKFNDIKNKIEILNSNKGYNINIKKPDEDDVSVPADLDLNEMILFNNSIKQSVKAYNNKKNMYNIQQKIQNKQLTALEDKLNEINTPINVDKPISYIKNPHEGTSLKVTEINQGNIGSENGANNSNKKKYLIHVNNNCLSYDKTRNVEDSELVDNYGLYQCNELDPKQHMSLDYFKLKLNNSTDDCKDNNGVCNTDPTGSQSNSNSNLDNCDPDNTEQDNSIEKDVCSYIKHYNKFISDNEPQYKLDKKQKKYKPDQMIVVQPMESEGSDKTTNCLTINNNKEIALQKCRLGNQQTWMPGYNKLSC